MNTAAYAPGFVDVAFALILVGIALAVSWWWKIPVQKDISLGSIRAFLQLVALGYVLEFVFASPSRWLVIGIMAVMLTVGAYTAAGKVRQMTGSFWVALISIALGSLVTLSVMLIVLPISFEPRYVIPLAGMLISNSMNASALTVERICSDLRAGRLAVESALALGKNWREATHDLQRKAATAGMLSILNFLKTVGIVALPGAMTGMILAGADPLPAAMFQLIVGFMLISAVTITSVVTLEFTVRRLFTKAEQLVLPPEPM